MDYYEVLGLNRNANKEEIKEAFRKKAMQFHPDKHSASPKSVRDGAKFRFQQASEAYEVLIDDSKRADYNLRFRSSGFASSSSASSSAHSSYGNGYGYGYGYRSNYTRSGGGGYYSKGESFVSKLEMALRFLTTRSFLLNLSLAGAVVGGTIIIETSRDMLWKMQNSGKSFEETMDSIEKTKAVKKKE